MESVREGRIPLKKKKKKEDFGDVKKIEGSKLSMMCVMKGM